MELLKSLDKETVVCGVQPSSFDICLIDNRVVFIKFKPNADKLMCSHAAKLRAISKLAGADPLVVSLKSGSDPLTDGVTYTRRNLLVLTPSTLKKYLEGEPLPKAEKGGFKAEIDIEVLKDCMNEAGMSKSGLARELGVSREMIRRYEHGESCPSLSVTEKLIDLFGDDVLVSCQESYSELPENSLSCNFRRMGFEAEAPLEAPFDVIARGKKLLLGIIKGHGFEKRFQLLKKFSEILDADSFVIGDSGKEEVPFINPEELKLMEKDDLIERVS